jgi:hypothetical protein
MPGIGFNLKKDVPIEKRKDLLDKKPGGPIPLHFIDKDRNMEVDSPLLIQSGRMMGQCLWKVIITEEPSILLPNHDLVKIDGVTKLL